MPRFNDPQTIIHTLITTQLDDWKGLFIGINQKINPQIPKGTERSCKTVN